MEESKTYEIGEMFCNPKGFVTMRSLSSLMVDVSSRQMKKVEGGLPAMVGKVWLLYSWDIEILSPIKKGDFITVRTRPTHMKRFFAYRDFIIEGQGQVLAKAKASFILFDQIKKRAGIIGKEVLEAYGESQELYHGRDYKEIDDFDKQKEIYIRRADFDKNSHVNNGVYFDYIREIPGFDEEKISYIKMIYKNQVRDEEKLGLFYKESPKKVDFKIGSDIDHAYGVVTYV